MRRAVNTPDRVGQYALWQGGMEPNIPVGSDAGVASGMARAIARRRTRAARGRERQVGRALEDGPHRPPGVGEGRAGQSARSQVPAAHLHPRRRRRSDAARTGAAHDPWRARSAERRRCSTATRSDRACKPRRSSPPIFSATTTCLYLMEDMATGEIRLSILWEWLHKHATLTADDDIGVKAGDPFTSELFLQLLAEEYEKLPHREQPRCSRRLEEHHAAHRPRDRRDLRHVTTSSCPGTSTCSTSISTTTT